MTSTWLDEVFNVRKPIIGMLHLAALPGDPGYDSAGGFWAGTDVGLGALGAGG